MNETKGKHSLDRLKLKTVYGDLFGRRAFSDPEKLISIFFEARRIVMLIKTGVDPVE